MQDRSGSPENGGTGQRHPVNEQLTVLEQFCLLPSVEPAALIGLWKGRGIPSDHPFDGVLENLGWFGKRFTADFRADALLFRSGEKRLVAIDPSKIPLRLTLRFSSLGRLLVLRHLFSYLQRGLRARRQVASLRTVSFEGVMSAAMVYDDQPIVDHFRRVDDGRIMGAMTIRGDNRIYFFELERLDES
ncbi:DUF4334 domain-containing protein [Pararhizobium sp. O133]|uniref:DUF4334 domain-containing protein n=1 Tax=Pararhizobium sp. O133 TaxID=3449278 RepID=UPI003F688795